MNDLQLFYTFETPNGTKKEKIPLSTALILQQADLYRVDWSILPGTRIIKLQYNSLVRYFRYQISANTSYIGFHASLDKSETSNLLKTAGISTAKGYKIYPSNTKESWLEIFRALKKPLVVKP